MDPQLNQRAIGSGINENIVEDNKLRLSDRTNGPLRNAMLSIKKELACSKTPARVVHSLAREKFKRQYLGKWVSQHRFEFESDEEKLAFCLQWN